MDVGMFRSSDGGLNVSHGQLKYRVNRRQGVFGSCFAPLWVASCFELRRWQFADTSPFPVHPWVPAPVSEYGASFAGMTEGD